MGHRQTSRFVAVSALGGLIGAASLAGAQTVPFTETFETGANGWLDAAFQPVETTPSGGPDGSAFITGTFNFVDFDPVPPVGGFAVMLRGNDANDASGDAFVGDWLDAGVTEFSAFVRHDAPEPLQYFARFATPNNFPGGLILTAEPVQPNVWTELTFDIDPGNPLFIPEGPTDFDSLFGNIGNVQLGIDGEPLAGLDRQIAFDADNVSITPAPASAVSLLAGLGLAWRRRR